MLLALPAMPALAQDTTQLDEIILVDSKRDVTTDTATPTTTVDQTEIDDRQATTIAELIDSVPGVSLVNGATPRSSGINIRGFGANGTYGTDHKVLVQLDGASSGAEELYRISGQMFTDPALYREAEVIRGMVGSFEFGTGAFGGVVRAESKSASNFTGDEPGLKVRQTLQFGTNGELDVSWDVVANAAMDRSTTPSVGYAVHNLRATYTPDSGILAGAEFRMGIENLTDKAYTPHLATRAAPGRTFKVSVAKTF